MYTIYVHTCRLNGKRYVGWTSLSIEERWQEHIGDTRRESSAHRLFKQALVKYGVIEWDHEVLETCSSEIEAQLAESKWIASLKTNALREGHVGYNMTDGGEGHCGPHSEATKKAISESLKGNMCGAGNKGRTWTTEQRARIAATLRGRKRPAHECQAVSDGLLGRKVSDETRRKLSLANKGKKHT